MRIIVPIIVWNMAEGLKRAVQSARDVLPNSYVVVVDGVYAQFPYHRLPGTGPASTDGTIEVAQGMADTVICRRTPWPSEVYKRNAYLGFGEIGDIFLHIDADEELIGTWPEGVDTSLDMWVEHETPPRPAQNLHRLFHYEHGLHYNGTHHLLWVGSKQRLPLEGDILPGVQIRHTLNTDPERAYAKGSYYQWLREHEKDFRRSHKV